MIELPRRFWQAAAARYPTGVPGPAIAVEHARKPGVGRWWVDRLAAPAAIAVACGDRLLLRGNARAFQPDEIAAFSGMFAVADAGFLPLLGGTFARIVPWERMVFVRAEMHRPAVPAPAGVLVRRLDADDHASLALPEFAWLGHTWGGPTGLAASGRAWGAVKDGCLLSVACTAFEGTAYEDIAAVTLPDHRGQGLALACVAALDADVAARGRLATWTCARDNEAARRLAQAAGFRLEREYVEYKAGAARTPVGRAPQAPAWRAGPPAGGAAAV
ncbi:GNAT family N-acetyltransferase [Streptomycetaceae bacterium NBC_01309]